MDLINYLIVALVVGLYVDKARLCHLKNIVITNSDSDCKYFELIRAVFINSINTSYILADTYSLFKELKIYWCI